MGFTNPLNNIEEHQYYETYYFCNVINNVLHEQSSFLRSLNDYYGDGRSSNFSPPFLKVSHFHDFIEFIILNVYMEDLESKNLDLLLNNFKSCLGFSSSTNDGSVMSFVNKRDYFISFLSLRGITLSNSSESDLEEFLEGFFESDRFQLHLEQTVKEVFYILFGNRKVLLAFNDMIARAREDEWVEGHHDEEYETRKGYLKRVGIPKWVRKAVFYRDKGVCVICKKDLTGLINNFSKENYDHIVPLARFGINDVSNIQLLCESCNGKKKANNNDSSNDYFPWYLIK